MDEHARHPPGLVHEYSRGEDFEHLEAVLACLETLAPEDGRRIRAQVDEVIAKYGRRASVVHCFFGECSAKLDALAPKGIYYRIPNTVSNMDGFWPSEWLKTVDRGTETETEARKLGACVIDRADSLERTDPQTDALKASDETHSEPAP